MTVCFSDYTIGYVNMLFVLAISLNKPTYKVPTIGLRRLANTHDGIFLVCGIYWIEYLP